MKKLETITLSAEEAKEAFNLYLSNKLGVNLRDEDVNFPEPKLGFKQHPTADYCTLIVNHKF